MFSHVAASAVGNVAQEMTFDLEGIKKKTEIRRGGAEISISAWKPD